MSKHTPGPWFIDKVNEGQWDVCHECDDENCWTVIHQATTEIGNVEDRLTDEDKANARLISAAPELLEALLDALPYVEDVLSNKEQLACFKPGVVERHAKLIRSAIAKATGDTP